MDLISLVALILLFCISFAYLQACDHLKGTRA